MTTKDCVDVLVVGFNYDRAELATLGTFSGIPESLIVLGGLWDCTKCDHWHNGGCYSSNWGPQDNPQKPTCGPYGFRRKQP